MDKCFVCGKEIQRNSIPRIEPQINAITWEDGADHLVCDTCGNLLTIMFKMIEQERKYYKANKRRFI